MKSPVLLLTIMLAAAPLAEASDRAHAPHASHGHGHAHPHQPEGSKVFGDAPLPVVWRSIVASREHIDAALQAGKPENVDAWAETIQLAAHTLADRVKVSDEAAQVRLAASLSQVGRLANEVLDAAQHANLRRASASFARLESALTLAQGRLPAELIEESTKAQPRFAAAPKHAERHHQH